MTGRLGAILTTLALAAGPAAGQTIIRIDDTHCDIAIEYVGGQWRAQVRPDEGGPYTIARGAPSTHATNVHLVANPSTITTTTTALPYLGLSAGGTFWHLNASQVPGQLELGLSAGQMTSGGSPGSGWASWQPAHLRPNGTPLPSGQWVEWQVRDVRGPSGSEFAVWLETGDGADVYVSTALNGEQSEQNDIHVLRGGHRHYNWGFTQAGRYEIDVDARTFYTSGGTIELSSNPNNLVSERYTFIFEVQPIPEPGSLLAACGAGLATIAGVRRAARRRR